jgi:hypothetical protein
MKESLFFELIQVSVGKLNCLSRGAEPEEWLQFHDIALQQRIEGICYVGVQRLFEFGLRAPQDVSIDWMAEAEDLREQNEQNSKKAPVVRYYPEELKDLRQIQKDRLANVTKITINDLYQLYLHRHLDLGALIDYYYTLQQTQGKYEQLKSMGILNHVGIRRFARGLMWMLQETIGMEQSNMPFEPLEKEGRFLLNDIMQKASKLDHWKHALTTYPLGIMGLRA